MSRKILGVIVGFILAVGIILIVEMIGTNLAPQTPKNLEYMTLNEREAYFSSMPLRAYLTTLVGYIIASFAGGWITTKISKDRHSIAPPLILGILLTIGGLWNFFMMLPGQPTWFVALSLITYIPLALIGHRFAR